MRGMSLLSSIIGLSILFNSSFSNNLAIIGSNEIGLYDFLLFGGLPGLGITIISLLSL
jgi:hypothetical protein